MVKKQAGEGFTRLISPQRPRRECCSNCRVEGEAATGVCAQSSSVTAECAGGALDSGLALCGHESRFFDADQREGVEC